jgi:glycosyltransferase involved in cell wall biosynthesis
MTERTLAIVIIARNEAQHIARCIESGLPTAKLFPGTEILLVDSASTDDTVEIARQYPISIIQLRPHWPLTPGAGRYLGTRATSSQYILFLDGDTELDPDWIRGALGFLRDRPQVAGVGGRRDEIYVNEQGEPAGAVLHRYAVEEATAVRTLGGDGLYRREALEAAGTFNPFLSLYEEAELALRLRSKGYGLWRLPSPMVRHFSPPRDTLQEAIRRFRIGFYPRSGRTLHATYRNGLAWQFIREFLVNYLITAIYLSAGLMAGMAALFGHRRWLAAWLTSSVGVFGAYSIRKGSLYTAFSGLFARLLVTYGLVTGFVAGSREASDYPSDVVVVQHGRLE